MTCTTLGRRKSSPRRPTVMRNTPDTKVVAGLGLGLSELAELELPTAQKVVPKPKPLGGARWAKTGILCPVQREVGENQLPNAPVGPSLLGGRAPASCKPRVTNAEPCCKVSLLAACPAEEGAEACSSVLSLILPSGLSPAGGVGRGGAARSAVDGRPGSLQAWPQAIFGRLSSLCGCFTGVVSTLTHAVLLVGAAVTAS